MGRRENPPAWVHVNGEKRCVRCNEWLPADKDFFYMDKNKKDGLRSVCRACYWETPSVAKRSKKAET